MKQGGRDHRNIIRMSPPMRGRGLKQVGGLVVVRIVGRPPCGGVD